jgi:uncharacterized membrane protein YbaN (DUF454 family)
VTGKRIAYIGLGLITTMLGIAGIFLPGLPTTVFIIIALWAFSRSSPKLHRWLIKLPILRETLQEIDIYQRQKDLPLPTKIISQSAAWLSCIICGIVFQSLILTIILMIAAVACSIFMFFTPTRTANKHVDPELLDI